MIEKDTPPIIGLVGCGTIGTEIARFLDQREDCVIGHIFDTSESAEDQLIENLNRNQPVKSDIRNLLLHCDVVIEAASKEAVKLMLEELNVLKTNNLFIILSTGGLTENLELYDRLNHGRFRIPSGAIGGLDALSAVKNELSHLSLKTTKPAGSLTHPENSSEETLLYDGDLDNAIALFPKNINVAATLYLTTRFEKLNIQVISSPSAIRNKHEIRAMGKFGSLYFSFENEPSQNPKTSALTLFSVIDTIEQVLSNLKLLPT